MFERLRAQLQRPVLLSSIFIIVWWSWAFYTRMPAAEVQPQPVAQSPSHNLLSSLDAKTLQAALQGDLVVMRRLLAQWDADARLLRHAGFNAVRPVKPERLETERLLRELESQSEGEAPQLLPQTYLTADILTALVGPESVVALPDGYRQAMPLLPPTWSCRVPVDLTPRSFEMLARLKPAYAFIADYSHPGSVTALQELGIPLVRLPYVRCLAGTRECIETVGAYANRKSRARLLSLFVDAALIHFHNRLATLERVPRVLFLNRYSDYSVPGKSTLTYDVLARMGLAETQSESAQDASDDVWVHPIALERVAQLKPEILLISSPELTGRVRTRICSEPALADCPAVRTGAVFEVDGTLQQSPSQYVVMGAFQLMQAVMKGTEATCGSS